MARPPGAARTGLTLMKTPKKWAGTRRRASRSARNGTAEDRTPAGAAQPTAGPPGGGGGGRGQGEQGGQERDGGGQDAGGGRVAHGGARRRVVQQRHDPDRDVRER